jgi:hypothetical protein
MMTASPLQTHRSDFLKAHQRDLPLFQQPKPEMSAR